MAREISSGGVVLREISGEWHVALIEPQKSEGSNAGGPGRKRTRARLALPKGLVDPGETAPLTAVREVKEETGIHAEIVTKLTDIKYMYVRTWGDGERVFKIVSFYLLRYLSGEIDDVTPQMRIEVKRAQWVPLGEAGAQLMYANERKVLRLAQEHLQTHGLAAKPDPAGQPGRKRSHTKL